MVLVLVRPVRNCWNQFSGEKGTRPHDGILIIKLLTAEICARWGGGINDRISGRESLGRRSFASEPVRQIRKWTFPEKEEDSTGHKIEISFERYRSEAGGLGGIGNKRREVCKKQTVVAGEDGGGRVGKRGG